MPAAGSTAKSDERRRVVVDAAVASFARRGFYGTTTQEIADLAGISQPYIYRLFASKHELFAASVRRVSARMEDALGAGGSSSAGSSEAGLERALAAYASLTEDREVMMFLMHANCAADEPLVGDAVRECYARQVDLVGRLVDGDDASVRQWLGAGMLGNVVTALRLSEVDAPWARTMRGTA